MAGDWIKWNCGLLLKPEVARMATALKAPREVVACRLMKFWEWCDSTIPEDAILDNGSAFVVLSPSRGDNVTFVDDIVGTPGFADSLAAVDWIRFRDGRVELPNFGRHNGETAKTRARNAKNQKKKRHTEGHGRAPNKQPFVIKPSPEMSPPPGDKLMTSREERREEDKDPPNPPQPGGGPVKETKPRKPPQHPERIPIPSELNSPDFLTAWATWLAARKVTEIGAGRQLKTLAGLGTAKAIEAIDEALRNEWTGIHPKPANGKPAGRPSPTTPPRDFVPGPESEAPTW